jgi:hypothetical protein
MEDYAREQQQKWKKQRRESDNNWNENVDYLLAKYLQTEEEKSHQVSSNSRKSTKDELDFVDPTPGIY